MKFEVIYSERAVNDLRNIYRYVESELLAPDAAKKLIGRITAAIDGLDEMPERQPLFDKEPWRGRGLRKLIIDNFIAFYLPVKNSGQVLIVAVMYGKRDIAHVLSDTDPENTI